MIKKGINKSYKKLRKKDESKKLNIKKEKGKNMLTRSKAQKI